MSDSKPITGKALTELESNNSQGYPFKTYQKGQIVIVYNLVKDTSSKPKPVEKTEPKVIQKPQIKPVKNPEVKPVEKPQPKVVQNPKKE